MIPRGPFQPLSWWDLVILCVFLYYHQHLHQEPKTTMEKSLTYILFSVSSKDKYKDESPGIFFTLPPTYHLLPTQKTTTLSINAELYWKGGHLCTKGDDWHLWKHIFQFIPKGEKKIPHQTQKPSSKTNLEVSLEVTHEKELCCTVIDKCVLLFGTQCTFLTQEI